MVLLSSSRFSLDLLMKSTTSFSNIRMRHNCPKIKRASSCRKSFSKTADFSNAPTPVVLSTSCSLAMTALHPMDENQEAWGVFQDKLDTASAILILEINRYRPAVGDQDPGS